MRTKKELRNKVVLITGAAGGFGQEMTRQLLLKGSHLLLTDIDHPTLHQTVQNIYSSLKNEKFSGEVLGTIAADLSEEKASEFICEQCAKITPTLDILINNAGIAHLGLFSKIPKEKWEKSIQVNLLASIRLTSKFLPQMMQRKQGHLVYVSSMAGVIGSAGISPYCAAKFGLRGFGESLYYELKEYKIDVTLLYPSHTRTPILDSEQFGDKKLKPPPNRLIYEPSFVVSSLIRGIEKGKLHVYPGLIPKTIYWINRIAPSLLNSFKKLH